MDGEQRRNGDNNNGGDGRQPRRAGIQLSYGGFGSAVCLPALLIVSLVYRGIPVARSEPGLTICRHRRFAIHNLEYRLPCLLLCPRGLRPANGVF